MAPGSSYGHSRGGINLSNYRLLNEKQNASPSYVYRTTHDHAAETTAQLGLGDYEHKLSTTLREEADVLQAQAAKLVETDVSAVEKALRAKLRHTEQLKNALHSALVDTINEIELCVQIKASLSQRLQGMERKADLNEARLQVRQIRPIREKTMDDVETVLMKQQGVIGSFMERVKRSMSQLDQEVQHLEQCRIRLEADLKDKVEAIDVDTKVLNIAPDGVKGDAASLRAKVETVMKTPHTWLASSDDNMKKARQWIASSTKLRKAIRHAVHNSRTVEHEVVKNLNQNMMAKLGHTRTLKDELEAQLDRVRQETALAKTQRANLAAAMEANRGPLLQAKERFQARKARPDRELVQDDVEAALATEIAHLHAVTSQLNQKLTTVENKIDSLDLAAATIVDNIKDKEKALALDERVAWLDGRVNIAVAPPSSVGSMNSHASNSQVPSTARSATLSRIQDLEKELTVARAEREALEALVLTSKAAAAAAANA